MSDPRAIHNRQEALVRSCLESAPGQGRQGGLFTPGSAEKRSPVQLHLLKQKLLNAALQQSTQPRIHKQLCGAAQEAAELAWNTSFPLLSFPCLFEEMTQAIYGRFPHIPARSGPGWEPPMPLAA